MEIKNDMKTHFYDLSNFVENVKQLAHTITNDQETNLKQLESREYAAAMGKLSGEEDLAIWEKIVETQRRDLATSIKNCDLITKGLSKIFRNSAKTQDDLDNELLVMKSMSRGDKAL